MRRLILAVVCLGLSTTAFAQSAVVQWHVAAPVPLNGKTWTSASSTTVTAATSDTDQGGAYQIGVVNESYVYVNVNVTPPFTAGNVCLEGDDGTGLPTGSDGSAPTANWTRDLGQIPLTNLATNEQYGPISIIGLRRFRVRLCTAITGAGTFKFWIQAGSTEGARVPRPVTTLTLSTTNLGISAVFTSPWRDKIIDGTVCVTASARADVASANAGFVIQQTNDPSDANFFGSLALWNDDTQVPAVTALPLNTTGNIVGCPAARFWRVVFTNGGTGQGSFKLLVVTQTTWTSGIFSNASSSTGFYGVPFIRPDYSVSNLTSPTRRATIGGLGSGATGGLVTTPTVCDSHVNVNMVTATTVLLVTGVSGRHVRICSIALKAAAADNAALLSGTGATCGTGTTGMSGGTTAATGMNFTANNTDWIQGSGLGEINKTNATGDSVCIVTSAAVQLSGRIGYAIY